MGIRIGILLALVVSLQYVEAGGRGRDGGLTVRHAHVVRQTVHKDVSGPRRRKRTGKRRKRTNETPRKPQKPRHRGKRGKRRKGELRRGRGKPDDSPPPNLQLGDLFLEFDFDSRWARCTQTVSRQARVYGIMEAVVKTCMKMPEMAGFVCAPAAQKKTVESPTGKKLEVEYQVAFGIFSVGTVLVPFKEVQVLYNCDVADGWKISNCGKATLNSQSDTVYLFKMPASELAWKAHHQIGKFEFRHPTDKIIFRPFPYSIDLPAFKPTDEQGFVIVEFFPNGVPFSDLKKFLKSKNVDERKVTDIMVRCGYIANLTVLILLNNDFEHGDFHTGNIMFDWTQMVIPNASIAAVGMNHIYVIDLDTTMYPGVDREELEKDIKRRNQLTSYDSKHLVDSVWPTALDNDDVLNSVDDATDNICGDNDVECTKALQIKKAMAACETVLYEEHDRGTVKRLGGLPSCQDALQFMVGVQKARS